MEGLLQPCWCFRKENAIHSVVMHAESKGIVPLLLHKDSFANG